MKNVLLTDIPHIPQVGAGADGFRGDCGPACVAMAVNGLMDRDITVDQASIACGHTTDKRSTGFGQLSSALTYYGLSPNYRRPIRAAEIREELAEGRPAICLLHYDGLAYKKQVDYHGWHFVLAVGCDGTGIIIHDPLFYGQRAEEGAFIIVADAMLETAMSYDNLNMHHQALAIWSPARPLKEDDKVAKKEKERSNEERELVKAMAAGLMLNYSQRELRLILNCMNYATSDPAGLPGHNLMLIVDKAIRDQGVDELLVRYTLGQVGLEEVMEDD